jgi:hypothetical protein
VTSSRAVVALCLLALGSTSACGTSPDAPQVCEGVATASSAATVAERAVLGVGSPYPADVTLSARAEALRTSQRARREAAWQVIARVVAPVPVPAATAAAGATVPRFRTWYDREDFTRLFQSLYEGLGPEGRAANARFSETALDEAFGFDARRVHTLDSWQGDRWSRYLAALDRSPALGGLAGARRVGMSPDTVRHLLNSYPEVLRCLEGTRPVAVSDGPAEATQRLQREPFALSRCAAHRSGPFYVAAGATLEAHLEGAEAAGATLRVSEGATEAVATARCTGVGAAARCTLPGPGVFHVAVSTQGEAAGGVLEVRHRPPQAQTAACLDGVFPPGAATVAMEWRRAFVLGPLPTYDTSAAGIARRFGPGGDETWGMGDGTAEPTEAQIYTQRLESGNTFRLAAMHIRTREVDQWLNITLWWSPNPDDDFGADRPAEVRALGGPWSNYKMCVSMDYTEEDPDPAGGFAQTAPTLGSALRAVYEGHGGPSWCSNPYIDAGPRLARSNCVGCHQHAMSGPARRRERQRRAALPRQRAAAGARQLPQRPVLGPRRRRRRRHGVCRDRELVAQHPIVNRLHTMVRRLTVSARAQPKWCAEMREPMS